MKNENQKNMDVGIIEGNELKKKLGSLTKEDLAAALECVKAFNPQNTTARSTFDSIRDTIKDAEDLGTYEKIDAFKDNQNFFDRNLLIKGHNFCVMAVSFFGMFKLDQPKFSELLKCLIL